MKKILTILFILFSAVVFGQKKQDAEIRHLKVTDIASSKTTDSIKILSNIIFNNSVKLLTKTVGVSDTILVLDNGVVKYKITSDVTDVTYAQLLAHIADSTLKVGGLYRITDFAQAYNIFDGGTNTVVTEQIGATEPLIVYALSTKKLDRVAYSTNYPNDIIYYEPTGINVTTDIGYSDGAGTLVADFKGIIEYRHDTKQNVSTWYDFRNIKFRRWAVDAVAYNGATAYVAKDVCKSGIDGKIYKCITATTGGGDPTVNTADWILWSDIAADAYISWTSDGSMFNVGNITTTNLVFDTATYQDLYTFGSWYQHVNNVKIGKNDLALVMDYGYNSTLNNIIFKTINDIYTCYSNEISNTCYNNTIDNGSNSNVIGIGFISNVIGIGFISNIIDNGFKLNTIGYNCASNAIGVGCSFNTIDNSLTLNTIGCSFTSSTIGYAFTSSIIGNNSKVSAGNNCQGNYIGDNNTQITLGNNCTGINVVNNYGTLTLGDNVSNMSYQNSITIDSILVIDSLTNYQTKSYIAAGGTIVLPTAKTGWGDVYMDSLGVIVAWAHFNFNSDGTVYLESNSARVFSTDTGTGLAIYDAGSGVAIKNRATTKNYVRVNIKY